MLIVNKLHILKVTVVFEHSIIYHPFFNVSFIERFLK